MKNEAAQSNLLNKFFSIQSDPADPTALQLDNKLFDLTVLQAEIWINGRRTAIVSDSTEFLCHFPLNTSLRFRLESAWTERDDVKAELKTSEFGAVLFGNQLKQPATPSASHKWSIKDLFQRNLMVNLMVDAQDVIARLENQSVGFAFYPFQTADSPAINAGALELLKGLKPKLLAFPVSGEQAQTLADSKPFQQFLSLCDQLEAHPWVQLDMTGVQPETLAALIAHLCQFRTTKEWWTPKIHLELCFPTLPDEPTAAAIKEALATQQAEPERLKLILSGQNPLSEQALQFNQQLARLFDGAFDTFGMPWIFPGAKSWAEVTTQQKCDLATAAPLAFEPALRKMSHLLGQLEHPMAIAISPWAFFGSPVADTETYQQHYAKADTFYFAGMISALMRSANSVHYVLNGPIGGASGIIRSAETHGETAFKTGAFAVHELFTDAQEIVLDNTPLNEKPLPGYEWAGIPGLIEPQKIPYIDMLATRSKDGSKLFLLVINRHPRKRAILRVGFSGFANLRPLQAKVVRAKKRRQFNTAEQPDNLICSVIPMRKYKTMDHVNLDIPASGIVSMLLSSEK